MTAPVRGAGASDRQAGAASAPSEADERDIGEVLEATLAYARKRAYTGWDYGDGMSSAFLQALPVHSRLLNLAVQELVKRTPVNLRPLFAVEQRRNYMGASLFAMANLTADRLAGRDGPIQGTVDYRSEARGLLDWLVEQSAGGPGRFSLGHSHQLQDLQGLADVNEPGAVTTSIGAKALLSGADLDKSFPETARTAAPFVVEDLDYRPTDHGARITYSQNHEGEYYTLNAGALAGRLFTDLYDWFGDPRLRERAREILDHIAVKQTPCGGWYYRDPPEASHLSMDTHHNGFIVESYLRYRHATDSDRYDATIEDGLAFFETLFGPDGAPAFDEQQSYPRDIHACAQGILTFTYAGALARARRTLDWTLDNLYAGEGRFYFRKHRFYTNRVTLMRWCEAWMAFALAEYLQAVHGRNPIETV